MHAKRIVPILIAACLVASTSCSDASAPTSLGRQAAPAAPAPLTTIEGVVHVSQTKANNIRLTLADGEDVILDGSEAASLANVENADVEVRGQWSSETFVVADFVVRQVDGADVMDGILTAMRTQDAIEGDIIGYALSLTRGSLVPLTDPPAELIAHVGERVWVAETADGLASAFGIISR
jgi:hypothetical protein